MGDSDTDVEAFRPRNRLAAEEERVRRAAFDVAIDFATSTPNFAIVLTYGREGCDCSPHFNIVPKENGYSGLWGMTGTYPTNTYMPFLVPGSIDLEHRCSYPRFVVWSSRDELVERALTTLFEAGGPRMWKLQDIAIRPLGQGNWTFLYEASHDCDGDFFY